jgi:hypothetical protein
VVVGLGNALMATRGRKPVGERAATSAERKAQFDKRMRNADGEVPDAPRRTPCVIYLCDEAREAMRRAREARRLGGQPQLLDSQLLELLVLAYDKQPQDSAADPRRDLEEAVARLGGPVLREFERLTERLRALEHELASARGAHRAVRRTSAADDPGSSSNAEQGALEESGSQ